jgi:hypothetical protein
VKNKFHKGKEGDWVEKSFADVGIEINGIPLPGSLVESPFSAALTWIDAFQNGYIETRDIAKASSTAWATLKERYAQDAESGQWILRSEETTERAPAIDKEPVAPETETVDLVVNRSTRAMNHGKGDVIVDGLTVEQEQALLERGYGNLTAACPEGMDLLEWSERPIMFRTVATIVREKRISRAYHVAVEAYREKHNFVLSPNPNKGGEMILRGPVRSNEKSEPFMTSGILTRKSDLSGTQPEHWVFRALTRGLLKGTTTAIRIPADEVRFRGPVLI